MNAICERTLRASNELNDVKQCYAPVPGRRGYADSRKRLRLRFRSILDPPISDRMREKKEEKKKKLYIIDRC